MVPWFPHKLGSWILGNWRLAHGLLCKDDMTPGLCFSKVLYERLIFGRAYIRKGLSTEGNLPFQFAWVIALQLEVNLLFLLCFTLYLGKLLWPVASSFIYIMTFLFLQLLYLLFACSCLLTQVQGKPYKSQGEEEKTFTKDLPESNQAIQNEASSVRGKREVTRMRNLTELCNPPSNFPPGSSSDCEKGQYLCYGHIEKVCKPLSMNCLRNVGQYKIPKCIPETKIVTIDLGEPRGMMDFRRTVHCGC